MSEFKTDPPLSDIDRDWDALRDHPDIASAIAHSKNILDTSIITSEAQAAGITQAEWDNASLRHERNPRGLTFQQALSQVVGKEKTDLWARLCQPQSEAPATKPISQAKKENRAGIAALMREALDSGDTEIFWQDPKNQQKAAQLGLDVEKILKPDLD